MVIEVTLKDIIEGGITPHGNPIALAVQRQTQDRHVRVQSEPFIESGRTRYFPAVVFNRTTCEHRVLLPESAVSFLARFEEGQPVEPFRFEIDYTYRTAGEEYLHRQAMKKLQKSKLFP